MAEELSGGPIEFACRRDFHTKSVSALWVRSGDTRIILLRHQDGESYQLVSKLHELCHILVAQAPAEHLPQEMVGVRPTAQRTLGFQRFCSTGDSTASFEARILEAFVEAAALDLEDTIQGRRSVVERHL